MNMFVSRTGLARPVSVFVDVFVMLRLNFLLCRNCSIHRKKG